MKTLSLCLIWLFAISLSFSVKANQAPDIPPPFQQQTTLSEKQFQRLERRMERAEKRIERRLQKQQDKPKNLLGRARAALVLSILGILPLIGIVFTLIAIPLLLSTNRAINKRPTENKKRIKRLLLIATIFLGLSVTVNVILIKLLSGFDFSWGFFW